MKMLWNVVGYLLLIAGTLFMVYVMGAVFSQVEGFMRLGLLWPAIVFHAVATALGIVCIGRAGNLKDVQQP